MNYRSTDAQGVKSYEVLCADGGYGPQILRVLTPTNPAARVTHNFVIVLPVQSGQQDTFGDGLTTLRALGAQNQYNLTIIEPSFAIGPRYADNPNDPNLHYESLMTQELVPWIKQHLSTSGSEQIWLIGFSKSGIGGQDLILMHPDLFTWPQAGTCRRTCRHLTSSAATRRAITGPMPTSRPTTASQQPSWMFTKSRS